MSATLTKETTELAAKFFEAKLACETGPVGLNNWIQNNEKVQIIDLRTPELFAKCHVPTAVNVSYDELESHLPKQASQLRRRERARCNHFSVQDKCGQCIYSKRPTNLLLIPYFLNAFIALQKLPNLLSLQTDFLCCQNKNLDFTNVDRFCKVL